MTQNWAFVYLLFVWLLVLVAVVVVEVEEGERRTPKAAGKQDGTQDQRQEQEAPKRWKVQDKVPEGFWMSLRSV